MGLEENIYPTLPAVDLAELPGPATSETFDNNPNAYGKNVTDAKLGIGSNKKGTDSTNPNTP